MTDPLGQSQVIPYLRELTKKGYQFTILSAEKKERLNESGESVRKLLERIGIEWKTIGFSTHPPILSKIYDQWKMNSTANRLQKQKPFDFVHCRSYVAAATGLKLFSRFHVPFLFDMRGFWVDERVDSGHWKINKPVYRFLYKKYKKKEREYLRNAAHIISLTEKGKEELLKSYRVPSDKVTVIPCCVDLEHFDYHQFGEEKKSETRKALGLAAEDKVLCYLGSLGGWYLTEEMLEFFSIIKKKIPSIKFLFITHNQREEIISVAKNKGISEADIIVQPASRDQVPVFLSISDWGISFIKDVYSKKASSPTKQGEIMAMGIPIICNDIGDTGKIIRESATGIVLNGLNASEYEEAASILMEQRHIDRSTIRESAYQYYDLEKGIDTYRRVYEKL